MLKIRLRRTGARKKPSYRIVVAEATAPRDGRYIEIIGTYDPLTDPATISLDGDRAKHWLSVGAQPTERVVKLMAREGLVPAPTYATAPKADGATAEAPVADTTPAAEPTAEAPTAEAATAEAPAEVETAEEPTVTGEAPAATAEASAEETPEEAAPPAKAPRARRSRAAAAAAPAEESSE